MDWIKLSSNYYLDTALHAAGEEAEILFVRALGYAGASESGGFVPEGMVASICPRRPRPRAEALVREKLWTKVRGGYQIRNWHNAQRELEALVERKRRDAERKRQERAGVHGQSADSPAPNPRTLSGESREEKKHPPYPPQAGGGLSRCQRHKARKKAGCPDCQLPPVTRPDATPIHALCDHGRHGASCPFCARESA